MTFNASNVIDIDKKHIKSGISLLSWRLIPFNEVFGKQNKFGTSKLIKISNWRQTYVQETYWQL